MLTTKGPWPLTQIEDWLIESRYPLRLACVGSDGFPRVVSLWFLYRDGSFFCVSHRDAPLVKLLRQANRVGFEVSPNLPPYCGVRGQGRAEVTEEGAIDTLLLAIDRYLGDSNRSLANWLLSRGGEEVCIRIRPTRFFSWDYRFRMDAAGEHDTAPSPSRE